MCPCEMLLPNAAGNPQKGDPVFWKWVLRTLAGLAPERPLAHRHPVEQRRTEGDPLAEEEELGERFSGRPACSTLEPGGEG